MKQKRIAFQGALGAFSDMACRAVYPGCKTLPCLSFDDAFAAVTSGKADLGMIPIENSIAGRVADVHHLLPGGKLHIIGEHYQPISQDLMAAPGMKLKDLKIAHSHVMALAQCRQFLRKHHIRPVVKGDTAGAAAALAKSREKNVGVIASPLAAKLYGLKVLAKDIADLRGNTTRFLIIARKPQTPKLGKDKYVTSIVFRVRSVPAALYKALGGFAATGINITKLESYLVDGRFTAAQFYVDVEGHPAERRMKHALEELKFFSEQMRILGVYKAHKFRGKK